MSVRDILAVLGPEEGDLCALAAAQQLATRWAAHVSAVLISPLPDEPLAYEPVAGAGVWAEMLAHAREAAAEAQQRISARLGDSANLRTVEALARDVGRMAGLHARYADLCILARPHSEAAGGLRQELVEGVLFQSGRPALIIPPEWPADAAIGRRPVLAWDASREATRALSEADVFLDACEEITVITVDAKPRAWGHGEQPGAAIAAHLARRKVAAQVRNIASERGESTTAALLGACRDARGDLIIMGGYHTPRLLELVFGGATRDLLTQADVPLLMAH
ncbi:MAG: universal stress protein [Hyphomonadaceae bacterium]|nr:universal stress protein [Hyphomonadaceae bacterium]